MLAVEGMSVSYGEVQALTSVSATVGRNEVVCLLGSNGAGRSTFMSALIGLVPLRQGTITFDGVPIHAQPTETRVAMSIASAPEGRGMLARMSGAAYQLHPNGPCLLDPDRADGEHRC